MRFTISLLGTEIMAFEVCPSESITLDELIAAGSGDVESVDDVEEVEDVTLSYGFLSAGEIQCKADQL